MNFDRETDPGVWTRYLAAAGFGRSDWIGADQDRLFAFLDWTYRAAFEQQSEPPAEVGRALCEALLRLSRHRLCPRRCGYLAPEEQGVRRCSTCGFGVSIDEPACGPDVPF